jgi:hypothetical protein
LARIRSIKPEYFDDPDVGGLSAEAALVFVGIWTQADKRGRLLDDYRRLKVRLRPYSPCDFNAVLAELVDAGFLIRYQSEAGMKLLQVRSFEKHQKTHKLEPDSHFPAPSNEDRQTTGKKPSDPPVSCLLSLGPDLLSLGPDLLSREVGGEPSKPASPPAPVLTFPTTGAAKSWGLTAALLTELQSAYEHVDILAEARKALVWVNANPGKKKTAKGMASFLVSWLNNGVRRGDFVRRAVADAAVGEDWFDVCKRTHEPRCPNRYQHESRMLRERESVAS